MEQRRVKPTTLAKSSLSKNINQKKNKNFVRFTSRITRLITTTTNPRYHEALSRVLPIAKTILKKHLLRITRKADLEVKTKAAEDALACLNEKVTSKPDDLARLVGLGPALAQP